MEKLRSILFNKIVVIIILIIGCGLLAAIWTIGDSYPNSKEIIINSVEIYSSLVGWYLLIGAAYQIKDWIQKSVMKK